MAKLENLAADPLEAAIGFEQALIGTVLFDQKMYYEAMDLTPQDFGAQKHQVIWAAVADLAQRDGLTKMSLIETLTARDVLDQIGDMDAQGADYIHKIASKADPAGLPEYILQVRNASTKRRLSQLGVILTMEARNGLNPDEIIEKHIREVIKIKSGRHGDPVHISAGVDEQMERIEKGMAGELAYKWVPMLETTRTLIPALADNDLWIVVGTPGSGKSSYARYEAIEGAIAGKSVLLLPYENSLSEIQTWAIAQMTGIDHNKIIHPETLNAAEYEIIEAAWENLDRLAINVQEMGSASIATIRASVHRFLLKTDLDLIVIDGAYLAGGDDDPYRTITTTFQGLRTLANELHVPIMATTQYNRGVMKREDDAEPELKDMLYGGENPARIITMMKSRKLTRSLAVKIPGERRRERQPDLQRRARMALRRHPVVGQEADQRHDRPAAGCAVAEVQQQVLPAPG